MSVRKAEVSFLLFRTAAPTEPVRSPEHQSPLITVYQVPEEDLSTEFCTFSLSAAVTVLTGCLR